MSVGVIMTSFYKSWTWAILRLFLLGLSGLLLALFILFFAVILAGLHGAIFP